MKGKILKGLSVTLLYLGLTSVPTSAGTWSQHQYCPPNIPYYGGWEYQYDDGTYADSGWNYIDGEWYYFDDDLFLTVDGVQTINDKDYYFDPYTKAMAHDKYVKIGSGKHGVYYWANSDGSIDYDNLWCPDF